MSDYLIQLARQATAPAGPAHRAAGTIRPRWRGMHESVAPPVFDADSGEVRKVESEAPMPPSRAKAPEAAPWPPAWRAEEPAEVRRSVQAERWGNESPVREALTQEPAPGVRAELVRGGDEARLRATPAIPRIRPVESGDGQPYRTPESKELPQRDEAWPAQNPPVAPREERIIRETVRELRTEIVQSPAAMAGQRRQEEGRAPLLAPAVARPAAALAVTAIRRAERQTLAPAAPAAPPPDAISPSAVPRVVQVTIGRVEIRASAPAPPPAPAQRGTPRAARISLGDYLRGQAGGRR
jgi:hypothetical protein